MLTTSKRILVTSFLICSLATTLTAQTTSGSPVVSKFLVEAGIEFGGDEILEVFFTNGEDQTMRAGQGGYLAAGGQFAFGDAQQILLRTTLGFKYNTTAAENANIRLTRLPVNAIAYYRIGEMVRIGAGITTHLAVKFRGDGFVDDIDLKSSLGPRVEVGYGPVALTYTSLNYEFEGGEEVSAGSFGLSASFTFPR